MQHSCCVCVSWLYINTVTSQAIGDLNNTLTGCTLAAILAACF